MGDGIPMLGMKGVKGQLHGANRNLASGDIQSACE